MITKKLIKPISKYGLANIDLDEYAKLNNENQDITLNNLTATSVYTQSAVFCNENKEPKVGFVYQNDNLEILNYPNESYTPTSNDSIVNKSYVDNAISNVDLSNYYNKSEIDSKVDTINGEIETIRNDLGDLENQVNENTNNINNCVKKNQTNTITTNKLLTTTNQNNSVFEINADPEKKMYFDFVQNRTGYRNWNHLIFRAKVADNGYINILDLYSRDTNEGLFINVENNKINFDHPTLIGNIATPIGDNDCANKSYVDAQIANVLQNQQEINLVEGVEVAIPNYKINNKQVYKKYCTTIQQLQAIFAIADYMSMIGLAVTNDGHYKNCPWYWGSSQVFYIDSQINGGINYNGFATSGHKIIVEFTKR